MPTLRELGIDVVATSPYGIAGPKGMDPGLVRILHDATAHRRFAVSINLNDGYDGGELWFPEFGPRRYRPPAGGAVVFSCSLLHEATRVTRGVRYATLPFLYDDAAARVREQNNAYLGEGGGGYRADAASASPASAAAAPARAPDFPAGAAADA